MDECDRYRFGKIKGRQRIASVPKPEAKPEPVLPEPEDTKPKV